MKKILITKPTLPDLEEYTKYLENIWQSKWLTNNGTYHKQLEDELAQFLNVKYVSLFTNGTLALLTAIQALGISGEVITTPYSFVATTNSLWWNRITPVFVDIESKHGTLDPSKIEAAITSKTTAILPVHVYGNPCRVEEIQAISKKYNLKVIYDAAHAFGNIYKGGSLLNWGDLSILSFHATKTFNTMEGGAIISHDIETKRKVDYLKNFGIVDETSVIEPGINSKMNEMQAALGLLQLKTYHDNTLLRKNIANKYYNRLIGVDGIKILDINTNLGYYNFGYYPIFIEDNYHMKRDELYEYLKERCIFARRYFYPLISNFRPFRKLPSSNKSNLKIATNMANRVLCLPIYPDLEEGQIDTICNLIQKNE